MSLADTLKRKGVRQPKVVIAEAKRADILVCSALALLQMETGDQHADPRAQGFELNQRNIFGCDLGEGVAFCHEKVTKDRVAKLRASGLANGVGWTQLTWPPLVAQADQMGGAHIPRYQMRAGFRQLRTNFDQLGTLTAAYRAYNGTGPAAVAYAATAVRLRHRWNLVTDGK